MLCFLKPADDHKTTDEDATAFITRLICFRVATARDFLDSVTALRREFSGVFVEMDASTN
jgi:hypothetical protein